MAISGLNYIKIFSLNSELFAVQAFTFHETIRKSSHCLSLYKRLELDKRLELELD